MHTARTAIIAVLLMLAAMLPAAAQRRITPVNPSTTGTQPVPQEKPVDPSRLVTTIDAQGRSVTVDTVTGREYTDSTLLKAPPPMEYPLIFEASAGINVWDPLMRAFGQKYGLGDIWAELNMHNRYFPSLAVGLGNCDMTPVNNNYTFHTPLAPYFKIGAAYNFLYNSNPDYKLLAGLRYGLSPFRWSVTDVTVDEGYWGTPTHYSLDNMSHTTGYLEVSFGLRVKLWRCISAGWNIVYHTIIHDSRSPHGEPMYIPGYGTRKGAVTGNVSIIYTLPLNKTHTPEVE